MIENVVSEFAEFVLWVFKDAVRTFVNWLCSQCDVSLGIVIPAFAMMGGLVVEITSEFVSGLRE